MEDENEVIDSTIDTDEGSENLEDNNQDDTLETESEVDVAQLQATNKKLFERAKKAEADLKALKGNPKPVQPTKTQASLASVEETVLLANGMSEELIEQLKKVAQVQGISLIKAQKDPIFIAVKETFEREQKSKDASMPASRSAGNVKPKKDFTTPNLSRDEHKAMFKDKVL